MSAVETGQMSAAETGQMSAVETRQMSTIETGLRTQHQHSSHRSSSGSTPVWDRLAHPNIPK